jgi:chemotaxis methyl-accepting protein methylase
MYEPQHPGDFAELTRKISVERGFGCASYKEKCLRRRIAVRMRARGVHSYADYARLLDGDAPEFDKLIDALTINVTKLFRNREAWDAIAARVLPEVLPPGGTGPVRVWSAGCSRGQEPYSLAVLLHRHLEQQGRLRELSRVQVLATDIDQRCLATAARGGFDEEDFAEVPAAIRQRYFAPEAPFRVDPAAAALVRFQTHDLLRDPAPIPGGFQLVMCRNVLIYFDRESQERCFSTFFDALAPGGFLVLGKVETLLGEARKRFLAVDARERIFRKPA